METGEETRQYKVWNSLNSEDGVDQFQLLEDKVDGLIEMIKTLKNEKESFVEKFQIQEEKLADLTQQVEGLKSGRDKAKQRIISLLEKIEQIGG
ncbi:MAG: cell division protein ZapB [Proteobacteria bacterium]|nr:cell division protein ZapB [Desulfobacterales bacterium]MBL6967823.1 cell division protein ZapB [Desulfobacteraceae bacterium]MBU0988835.1 cell division protein ZapB [Pseudomonadota bacterium]MBL7102037.1 cell division protein ZapB [Desulfobacteraceae bacterium]MBL7173134.1 cell division protein ZapB [Desulfobacteraceae bacterium]